MIDVGFRLPAVLAHVLLLELTGTVFAMNGVGFGLTARLTRLALEATNFDQLDHHRL